VYSCTRTRTRTTCSVHCTSGSTCTSGSILHVQYLFSKVLSYESTKVRKYESTFESTLYSTVRVRVQLLSYESTSVSTTCSTCINVAVNVQSPLSNYRRCPRPSVAAASLPPPRSRGARERFLGVHMGAPTIPHERIPRPFVPGLRRK
jgi:hypothetical protein